MAVAAKAQREIKFWWRDGYHAKGNADEIGQELRRVAAGARLKFSALTARIVVDAAQDRRAYPCLHSAIEWDDETAADKYRLHQARNITRALGYRIIDGGERTVYIGRASIVNEQGEHRYYPIPVAVRNAALRDQMLDNCLQGIRSWEARHRQLGEADRDPRVRAAFRLFQRGIARLREAIEGDQPQAPPPF